jgi:hypothetical protein
MWILNPVKAKPLTLIKSQNKSQQKDAVRSLQSEFGGKFRNPIRAWKKYYIREIKF